MSAPETSAAELARAVGDAMESRRVPYAIGDAIAYGIWALPRATQDVDVTVFVEGAELDLAFGNLRPRSAKLRRGETEALAEARDG